VRPFRSVPRSNPPNLTHANICPERASFCLRRSLCSARSLAEGRDRDNSGAGALAAAALLTLLCVGDVDAAAVGAVVVGVLLQSLYDVLRDAHEALIHVGVHLCRRLVKLDPVLFREGGSLLVGDFLCAQKEAGIW
jgi:hypothetical protein